MTKEIGGEPGECWAQEAKEKEGSRMTLSLSQPLVRDQIRRECEEQIVLC